MNFRTTLGLAVVLGCLALGYLLWRPTDEAPGGNAKAKPPSAAVARKLVESGLDDVTKLSYRRGDAAAWTFDKQDEEEGSTADWRMTAPLDIPVASFEVDRIIRKIRNLEYEISYDSGITGAEAGLDPPEGIVTLTGKDGKPIAVEIGREAVAGGTYVRLSGGESIRVSTTSLAKLFKDKPLEYRNLQVCNFKPEDVQRIEVEDRSDAKRPVTYVLARHGDHWMFEAPMTARATSQIDEVARTLSRLRAAAWLEAESDRLGAYGLDPAALTVRATVVEEEPAEEGEETDVGEDGEQDAEPQTVTKETVHVIHLSDRSPIGEDTKAYMRIGDEKAVATVMKSTVDKLVPDESTWREMRMTTVSANEATKVALATPEGEAELLKANGLWSFGSDGSPAEDSSVVELLNAIGKLKAVAFTEYGDEQPAAFGLDKPQATISLTIPGVEGQEQITVGGFTDEQTKRLVYVRRNDLDSIGKVRVSDVELLVRGPQAYRDRTVFKVRGDRFRRIVLTRQNRFTGEDDALTFEWNDDAWSMTSPVSAPVREDRLGKLADAIGTLRAAAIVDISGEPSAFGLNAPDTTVEFTYLPPEEYKFEKQSDVDTDDGNGNNEEEEAPDEDEKTVPVKVQPPAETLTLLVTEHDGKVYAKRADRAVIYAVDRTVYDQLHNELRLDQVLSFNENEVVRFSIREGSETHSFKREDDKWLYEREPDLPLDAKKVDNLLLQIKDLDTPRYAVHQERDLSAFGLASPYHEVVVELGDGGKHVLLVAGEANSVDPGLGHYATVRDHPGVFLLSADAIERFAVSLGDLEAAP